jgi:transcriptional regulator with XRE-family HTH domain
MQSLTVREEIARLRAARGMTMREVAEKCDIHFSTIHKAESVAVRWETIHTILVAGFGVKPGSKDYERVKEYWLTERLDRRPRSNPLVTALNVAASQMNEKQIAEMQKGMEKLAERILRKAKART